MMARQSVQTTANAPRIEAVVKEQCRLLQLLQREANKRKDNLTTRRETHFIFFST